MKVLIKYYEVREYSTQVVKEMTKKEYKEFCEMTNCKAEEILQFCADDIAGHEQTTTHYKFEQI